MLVVLVLLGLSVLAPFYGAASKDVALGFNGCAASSVSNVEFNGTTAIQSGGLYWGIYPVSSDGVVTYTYNADLNGWATPVSGTYSFAVSNCGCHNQDLPTISLYYPDVAG